MIPCLSDHRNTFHKNKRLHFDRAVSTMATVPPKMAISSISLAAPSLFLCCQACPVKRKEHFQLLGHQICNFLAFQKEFWAQPSICHSRIVGLPPIVTLDGKTKRSHLYISLVQLAVNSISDIVVSFIIEFELSWVCKVIQYFKSWKWHGRMVGIPSIFTPQYDTE